MKYNLLTCFVVILLISCNLTPKSTIQWEDGLMSYKKDLSDWTTLNVDDVMSHFPEKISNKKYFWRGLTNTPLFGDNSNGVFYVEQIPYNQIVSIKNEYFFIDSIMYYSSESFRIQHYIVNDTTTLFDVCTLSRYPIPTFYYGLSENKDNHISQKWLNEMDSMRIPKEQIKYYVPEDLMVYVIDAKPGFFWKDKENILPRPSIGKWKNGYSRGISISKTESLICYWFMIW